MSCLRYFILVYFSFFGLVFLGPLLLGLFLAHYQSVKSNPYLPGLTPRPALPISPRPSPMPQHAHWSRLHCQAYEAQNEGPNHRSSNPAYSPNETLARPLTFAPLTHACILLEYSLWRWSELPNDLPYFLTFGNKFGIKYFTWCFL